MVGERGREEESNKINTFNSIPPGVETPNLLQTKSRGKKFKKEKPFD